MGGRAWLSFVLLLVLAAAAGCTRPTDGYCCTAANLCDDVGGVEQQCPSGQLCDDNGDMGPKHSCYDDPNVQPCVDDPGICETPTPACVGGICVECDDDADCGDATAPHCDLSLNRCGDCDDSAQCTGFDPLLTCGASGACVECEPTDPVGQNAVCDAATPVCGTDGACRHCEDHRECDSGACDLSTGACVDAADIAYVDHAASGGNTACTASAKCDSITKGLAVNRPYLVMSPGSYVEDVIVMDRDVSLIGPGVTLRAASNLVPAIRTGGASGEVAIYGMTITASTSGVDCTGSAGSSTARTVIVDAVISNHTAVGVSAYRCDLVVSRSRVTNANGGGIDLTQAGFDITNSVIDGNGPDTFGGIQIASPRPSPARLAFDTIVGNSSSAATAPGVSCTSATALAAFHSNIIDGNVGGTTPVSGTPNCAFSYSLINPATAGDENVSGDPMLGADFHIPEDSPARDHAMPDSGVLDDMDRDARPTDIPDIGADEYVP